MTGLSLLKPRGMTNYSQTTVAEMRIKEQENFAFLTVFFVKTVSLVIAMTIFYGIRSERDCCHFMFTAFTASIKIQIFSLYPRLIIPF